MPEPYSPRGVRLLRICRADVSPAAPHIVSHLHGTVSAPGVFGGRAKRVTMRDRTSPRELWAFKSPALTITFVVAGTPLLALAALKVVDDVLTTDAIDP